MPAHVPSPDIPDLSQPLPIPERDPEGVNLSILGLSELVGPAKNSGILAVTAGIIDFSVRGYLTIREADGRHPGFILDRGSLETPGDNLLTEEQELLELLFHGRADSRAVHLDELAEDPAFRPGVQAILRGARKRLTEGEQYLGTPRSLAHRLKLPLIAGGLLLAGVSVYEKRTGLAAAGLISSAVGGIMSALDGFDSSAEVLEKTGRQSLGDVAILGYDKLLRAARPHIESHAAIIAYLTSPENQAALAPLRADRDLVNSYERALSYLKIMKLPGIAQFWGIELAHMYTDAPAWFRHAGDSPGGHYEPNTLATSLVEFLDRMDGVLLSPAT